MLDKLLEEIEKLQLAESILRNVFAERNNQGLSYATISRIEKYFNYDDSE